MDNSIIPVVAAVIVQKHPIRILLHKKNEAHDEEGIPRNPELVGLWEFAGGMMKYGETPEGALFREAGEELNGVIITVDKLLHAKTNIFKDGVHYLILYYECHTSYEAEPEGCIWAYPRSIMEMDCIPGTYEIVKKFYLGR
jgi:ADP-ribose pyrophosphatase YjhB (NUDIX family)